MQHSSKKTSKAQNITAESQVETWAQTILQNAAFSPDHYRKEAQLETTNKNDLAIHYITIGENLGICPSTTFDPVYFSALNPQANKNDAPKLINYIEEEKYKLNIATKEQALKILEEIEGFALYRGTRLHVSHDRKSVSVDEARLNAEEGFKDVIPDFDYKLYSRYIDAGKGLHALLHFVKFGFHQGRVYNSGTYAKRKSAIAGQFDEHYYIAQRAHSSNAEPLDDWIFHGSITGLQPCAQFSPSYYKKKYPDVSQSGWDLFEHFSVHGKKEGRNGYFEPKNFIESGGKNHDGAKETVIIAIHEASKTGAPILGLHIAKKFSIEFNVIIFLGKRGQLTPDLKEISTFIATGNESSGREILEYFNKRFDICAVILNSVECAFLSAPILENNLASVALIHEFSTYTLPKGKMTSMVEFADIVVVPAPIVERSLQEEILDLYGTKATNVIVRHQGYLPRNNKYIDSSDMSGSEIRLFLDIDPNQDVRIVLGAGYVQLRKGVDLFIQTAHEVRKMYPGPIKFVWIGDGYNPQTDPAYSVWLQDMIARLDLHDVFTFMPHQSQVDEIMKLADVFFLSSRLDPFPNVAIDAILHDKPIVCFDQASGLSEIFESDEAKGSTVGFLDTRAAAIEIANWASPTKYTVARKNNSLKDRFSFDDYISDLKGYIRIAQKKRKMCTELLTTLKQTNLFDAGFYEGKSAKLTDIEAEISMMSYAARAKNGLWPRNPRPGFNERLYHASIKPSSEIGLLAHGVRATHLAIDLERLRSNEANELTKAIHIHLHYSELAPEFFELIKQTKLIADIFISTTSRRARIEVEYAFREYTAGEVTVTVVENKGRDILPFVSTFKADFLSGRYEIIGHFHGKKSLAIASNTGERWRKFLLNTLIGDEANIGKIMSLFAKNPRLGMIFAEDRHSVGWTKNKPFAEMIKPRLHPQPTLQTHPTFPIGTMFWARAQSLKSLWMAENLLDGLPPEPLKYDGTILHAIERMLPSIVESNDFDWATVHRHAQGW
ncbi:glycosyltransferase [Pigmentiphaga aceris]|uniref:Glycosyltransferase n=1 Tax=Pigmentiphaga aceris TaxID=1940612 RepID=A0A5C0B0X9_9BURK|nr:rhamnan synthesis F family protein [Pigmentiphaga aceris]QEI08389.1 glycosyltransferase [Pigmentiphaga aceris]